MNTRGQLLTILFLFSSFGGICKGFKRRNPYHPHIVGGEPAEIEDFPYQVSLEAGILILFFHTCGASVISNNWVVTAAHCFPTSLFVTYRIRAGTSLKNTGGEIYEIEDIIIHPEFDITTDDYDIALVKVSKPFEFSEVLQPIELAKATPSAGTPAMLTGWGCVDPIGIEAEQLQKARITVVDHDECQAIYEETGYPIAPHMICAGEPAEEKNICDEDCGNPLVTEDNQLVGVVSWGVLAAYPIVFSDIASARDWITNITGTT